MASLGTAADTGKPGGRGVNLVRGFLAVAVLVAAAALAAAWPQLVADPSPIEDAYVDLSDWSPETDGRVSLHGPWAGAWQRLVDPAALTDLAAVRALPERIRVPDYGATLERGAPQAKDQHATYALVLGFGKAGTGAPAEASAPVVLNLGRAYSASQVFINGEPRGGRGTPAETAAAESWYGGPLKIAFQPPAAGQVVVVLHRSNHGMLSTGIVGRPSIASVDQTMQQELRLMTAQIPLFGGGLVMAMIFLTLFAKRRSEISFFLFSINTLVLIYQVVLTTDMIQKLGIPFNFDIFWRTIQVSIILSPGIFYHFNHAAFPHLFPRWPIWPLWILSLVGAVLAFGVPEPVAHGLGQGARLVILALFAAILVRAIIAIFRAEQHGVILTAAIGIYFATIIHDIAYWENLVPQIIELRQLGILTYLLLMAFFLAWRYQEAFANMDRLSARLQNLNAQLDERVQERTRELEREKAETERAQRVIHDSLANARRMQQAALPRLAPKPLGLADTAVWWQPRDQVGGDFYRLARSDDGRYVAVILMDCTGHGVPGALISFTASAAADRALTTAPDWSPEALLYEVDDQVRHQLHGAGDSSAADDGLEAGVLVIDRQAGTAAYAGVGLHLFVAGPDGIEAYHGTRGGLGYGSLAAPKRIPRHVLTELGGKQIFLPTDGLLEQPGGAKRIQLGRKEFQRLLAASAGAPDLAARVDQLQRAFDSWRGAEDQRDDITLLALKVQ